MTLVLGMIRTQPKFSLGTRVCNLIMELTWFRPVFVGNSATRMLLARYCNCSLSRHLKSRPSLSRVIVITRKSIEQVSKFLTMHTTHLLMPFFDFR